MADRKSVLVTGSNSGFGRLTAELFARSGWRVFGTMRNVAGVNAGAAAELRGVGIDVVELDVTDDASVDAAAAVVAREVAALDVLVNNAGSAHFGILEAFTIGAVEQQFATNVFGPLRVNRAFLPAMRARKSGLVVYVSSVVGRIVMPFGGVYAASKWALEALAEASSYELAPFNVDVAIVEPGAYATDIFGKTSSADDAARIADYGEVAAWASATPTRIAERAQGTDPGDVARAIVALAEAPAGRRPKRTVVADNPGVDAINAAIAPIQHAAAASLGIEALLPKTPL
jgi:NAD(P)-dependent dehydrogenase (short-subunit alcohol dehydrogenase family)